MNIESKIPDIDLGKHPKVQILIHFGYITDSNKSDAYLHKDYELLKIVQDKSNKDGIIKHGNLCISTLKAIDLLDDPAEFVRRVREDPGIIFKDFILQLVIHILQICAYQGYPIPRSQSKEILKAAGLEAFITPKAKRGGRLRNKWIMRYILNKRELIREIEYTENFIRKHMTKKRYSDIVAKERDVNKAFYEAFGEQMPEDLLIKDNHSMKEYAMMFLHHYYNLPFESLRDTYKNRKKITPNTISGNDHNDEMGMCISAILSLSSGSHGLYKKTSPGLLKYKMLSMTLAMGGTIVKKSK